MGYVFHTEEQAMAIDGLRRYLKAEVEPLYWQEFRDEFVPKERLLPVMQSLSGFGLVSGVIDEQHGGLGVDWLTSAMLFEEIAAASCDLSLPVLINSFGAYMLQQLAPDHLRDRYLPGLLSGEKMIAIGISEPDVGSNVVGIRSSARREGDYFVLNGEKTWISNGSYSDFLICTCRTSSDPREGLTHFLLDRAEHAYEVREIPKVALSSQSTAQVFLHDVKVPASNMLGREGQGLRNTLSMFERSRVFVALAAVGIARRALEQAVSYAQERKQHGLVIAGHQLVSAMLADMAVQVDAARLLSYRAAQMIEAGVPAEMEAAMAKYHACEMAVKVTRQALQIHGGNGVTREYMVEKLAREALILPIPEGTSQIQQLIIGRALTGVSAI